MFGLIFFIISVVILIVFVRVLLHKSDFVKFFATGLDSGFKVSEIFLLYQAASFSNIPEPVSLFLSVPALNSCIAFIMKDMQQNNLENDPRRLAFIDKLYKYRTKVELDPRNSNSMKTTKSLKEGQKLRVVLKGFGVFSSSVVNAGRELLITLPLQKNVILISGNEWVGREISVYLQRAGDAGYVFDSVVKETGSFHGATVLVLDHTENLIRYQKRKSVRCACSILGQLYIVNSETMSKTAIETTNGLKCLIEDLSEDGALIRIGGKGKKNIKIKIQFTLGENYIVMFGVVRAVEYNAKSNQSRLHFECVTLPQKMKNDILTYVYNVIPQEEKDAYDAITQVESEAESDAANSSEGIEAKLAEDGTVSQNEVGVKLANLENIAKPEGEKQPLENVNNTEVENKPSEEIKISENKNQTKKFEEFLKSENQSKKIDDILKTEKTLDDIMQEMTVVNFLDDEK